MSDLFCRHNRFTADCPICSKGTLLENRVPSASRPRKPAKSKPDKPTGTQFRGPYATAGPYEREGETVEVRLEKVPGGVRLAEWAGGALRRQAPVLPARDIPALVAQARERELLGERDLDALEAALAEARAGDPGHWGASSGRTGDLQEELRVEAVDEGAVRVARWILRPGAGWELQDAPPMLPAARFAQALAAARRVGVA
ncbi:MAG: hypothetical protein M3229_01890 [Actinomycetota bacterium]|nr:hypothetical protein [Actinomycetota bacterium]